MNRALFIISLILIGGLAAKPKLQVKTITIEQTKVDIFQPKSCQRTILVLPGYNHSRKRLAKETDLLAQAQAKNFCLVMPEMGRAIYSSVYFKETKRRAFKLPSARWMLETFLPKMQQQHKLLLPWQKNYILGISTGGRGAVLIALKSPGFFKGVAALSGDFDQSQMPKDKLMSAVYGPFDKFENRWYRYDNPYIRAGRWRLPLYLAHGRKDKVVPFSQSQRFYKRLKKLKPKMKIKLSASNNGHNYKYWNQEIKKAMVFFDNL